MHCSPVPRPCPISSADPITLCPSLPHLQTLPGRGALDPNVSNVSYSRPKERDFSVQTAEFCNRGYGP